MTGLPQDVLDGVTDVLHNALGIRPQVETFVPVSGGCINNGGILTTSEARFFLKWNSAEKFPKMFEAEARGLKLLANADAIDIPAVLGTGEKNAFQFIVMTHIDSRQRRSDYWEQLGRSLAHLHRTSSGESFGLDHTNYIGSLPQYNAPSVSWVEFFIHQRLEKQFAFMRNRGIGDASLRLKLEKLYQRLPEILTGTSPALLHGDLWSGNVMVNSTGEPALIDPAVYYGHPEVDLGMTMLFGGFGDRFFDAYNEEARLAPGYQQRFSIYNLYPLMVHVNLFGGGYYQQVLSVLSRFT